MNGRVTAKSLSCTLFFCFLTFMALLPELSGRRSSAGKDCVIPLENTKREIRILGEMAEMLRSRRHWLAESSAGRQAGWLQAKADYAVWLGESVEGPNEELNQKNRRMIHQYCGLLLMACHQHRQGMTQLTEENGARLRAYQSETDGSLQTYSVSVPAVYDSERAWPLVVSLHGHGWFRPFQGHPAPVYRGAFVLSPQGRGATDYKGIGEQDVLSAIAEVKQDFNIDPDRVYLMGASMGGTGAFHLGVHYADQFAAVFPIVGNADHRAWTEAWGWNREYPGRNKTLRDWLQNSHSAITFAENLEHLPIYIMAGAADTVVPPTHSRNMADALRRLNYRVEYREFPNSGHGGFSRATIEDGLAWTCSWKREKFPRKIRWKASTLRHGKAYWLRMEQMAAPLCMAEISAEVTAPNQVRIQTENLLSFSIFRSNSLFDVRRPLFLRINGERVIFPPRPDGSEVWLTVCHDAIHGWDWKDHLFVSESRKKRGMEGPVSDALLAPFAVIVGTHSPVQGMNSCWQREARLFQKEWQRRNNAPCLLMEDDQCTPELVFRRNLILFGGPRDNSISALLEGSVPLREIFEPLSREIPFEEQDDTGYILTYPAGNYSPGRLLVMISANAPPAAEQIWGRFGNWFNWGVYDSKKYFDYAVFDALSSSPETMLILGWFGTDWQVQTGKYFSGNPQLRRLNQRRGAPKYDSVLRCADVLALPLSELRPQKLDQMRGAVGWNTTFWGRPIPGAESGFGVRAPASMTFALNRQYHSFTCRAAMDNSPDHQLMTARRQAEKVRFILWGDGLKKAEVTVSWQEPEKELKADITGVGKLVLETVPAGGPSWLHSGAVWKNPTVRK